MYVKYETNSREFFRRTMLNEQMSKSLDDVVEYCRQSLFGQLKDAMRAKEKLRESIIDSLQARQLRMTNGLIDSLSQLKYTDCIQSLIIEKLVLTRDSIVCNCTDFVMLEPELYRVFSMFRSGRFQNVDVIVKIDRHLRIVKTNLNILRVLMMIVLTIACSNLENKAERSDTTETVIDEVSISVSAKFTNSKHRLNAEASSSDFDVNTMLVFRIFDTGSEFTSSSTKEQGIE